MVHETLKRAPIFEAVIDVQHGRAPQVVVANLESKIEGYDERQSLNEMRVGFRFEEGTVEGDNPHSKLSGYRYEDKRARRVVQFRQNGMTFSKLEPYESWDKFQPEGEALWERYCRLSGVAATDVTRVAVRYVNRLLIPMDGAPIELQDYLIKAPQTPDEVNRREVDEFFCRMVMPIPDYGGEAIIISTIQEPESGRLMLVLDLDLFMPCKRGDIASEEQLWDIFGQMREVKNELFFNMMGEKALELCR